MRAASDHANWSYWNRRGFARWAHNPRFDIARLGGPRRMSGPALPTARGRRGYMQHLSGAHLGDPDPAEDGAAVPLDLLQEVVPAVSATIQSTQDPYRQAEILRARLARLEQRGAARWRIDRTRALLKAAERKIGLQAESQQSTREWRVLGKAGIGTGIAVGGALIVLLLALAGRAGRR